MAGTSVESEKTVLIEWTAMINCLNEKEKKDLEKQELSVLERQYELALLQVQDEIFE